MALTLLQMVQDVANIVGLDEPSAVIGTRNATAKRLLPLFHRAGPRIRAMFEWPQLTREHPITLVAAQQSYALPEDFDSIQARTAWDRNNNWMLRGPISGPEWQYQERSLISASVRDSFRIWKWTDAQIHITETPSSAEAGYVYGFEYQSKTWVRPQKWAEGSSYSTGTKVWHNGNRYSAVATGTAGSTAPTHTTGSASDGGVTWTYISSELQERFATDTDVSLLDEQLIMLFVEMEYYKQVGQLDAVQAKLGEFETHFSNICNNMRGTQTINFLQPGRTSFIGDPLLPDGDWTT